MHRGLLWGPSLPGVSVDPPLVCPVSPVCDAGHLAKCPVSQTGVARMEASRFAFSHFDQLRKCTADSSGSLISAPLHFQELAMPWHANDCQSTAGPVHQRHRHGNPE
jgi:hypothetical protein